MQESAIEDLLVKNMQAVRYATDLKKKGKNTISYCSSCFQFSHLKNIYGQNLNKSKLAKTKNGNSAEPFKQSFKQNGMTRIKTIGYNNK